MVSELVAVQNRLEETDAEIAGTVAHLERLKARRKDILVDLNVLSSPFFKLPPELICEIFLCCLPPARTLPHPKNAPLLLGQVCRQWRSIALGLPTLYQSICVAAVLEPCEPSNGPIEMLDTWLERSGGASLTVSIIPDDKNPPSSFQVARSPLFRKLRHSSHRWRELEIIRRLTQLPALLRSDEPWDLPQLEKLTLLLSHNTRPETPFLPATLSNLTEAPALREVHLMGLSPRSLLLPWWQLTTIHAENLLPIEVIETLAQSTSLRHAAFALWPTPFFRIPENFPVGRPRALSSLALSGEICTPLLEYLSILEISPSNAFSISFGPDNELSHLLLFLANFKGITAVSIDIRAALPLSDLTTILLALPHVKHLSLGVHNGLMNGVLPQALHVNAELLPALERLVIRERIDRYHEPALNPEVVVEMLRARWERGLKAFRLASTHAFVEVHPGFMELAKDGMEIELSSHGTGPFLVVYYKSANFSSPV